MGGLSEKANVINKIWKSTGGRIITVDSGNMLFSKSGKFHAGSPEYITAAAISDIYSLLGFDAMGVGSRDLSGGPSLLISTRDKGVPWTSANLYDQDEQLLFAPYKQKSIDNLTIAIVGVTDPSPHAVEGFIIKDPVSELTPLVEELTDSFDLIILLSSLSFEDTVRLVEQLPHIDIAISADNGKGNVGPVSAAKSLVTQTGNRGRYQGVLSVTWNGQPWGQSNESTSRDLRHRLKSINQQLSQLQNNQWDSVSQKEKIAQLKNTRVEITQQIEQLEKEMNSGTAQKMFSTCKGTFLRLNQTGTINQQIDYIIRDTKKRIADGG